ncbi:RNA polymerase II transcription factor B subunit 3-like isoform X4 [Rhododendron vialii]|uniref:RNA polymerase II transcription factor B subunit 3-like isoform X4 n=1 Tax=Rhododendron vialii TaxID=182163 RepID=UPI00265F3019|nr:RNA polymerase II transcription factor B subunit 3-like isoform X4 [Rhododendron vialii]
MVVANSFSKEMAIRKRIASIFNKREEEEVEDMTFNLIEGIDVPAIDGKIAQYHKENAEQIMNAQQFKKKAQARKAEEYAAALAASKGHSDSDPGYKSMKEGFGITSRHPSARCFICLSPG